MDTTIIDLAQRRRLRAEAKAGWAHDTGVSLEAERDPDTASFITIRTETSYVIIEQSLDRDEARALALVLLNFASSPHGVVVQGGGPSFSTKAP